MLITCCRTGGFESLRFQGLCYAPQISCCNRLFCSGLGLQAKHHLCLNQLWDLVSKVRSSVRKRELLGIQLQTKGARPRNGMDCGFLWTFTAGSCAFRC